MSANSVDTLDALKTAVVARLRAYCSLSAGECDITPDGRPHPDAGQRFVAVHGGRTDNRGRNCIDEYTSFVVTITCRTGDLPFDRVKREGKALARKVKAALNMSYATTALATQADADMVFTEPPKFESESDDQIKGNDWFFAEDVEDAVTGIAIEVRFEGARRIRLIEDLDNT